MASVQLSKRVASASSIVLLNFLMRYHYETDDLRKVGCEARKKSTEESMTVLEMQKQRQRIGRKLYSGEGDNKEEQELLNLLESVKAGDLSAEDGIEKVRREIFSNNKQTYDTHICGNFLEGWHTCFFDKLVQKKTSVSNDNKDPSKDGNENKIDKNILLECKDPYLLALQSCMFKQTERVKEVIKANMGDEAYQKWYMESKRNSLRTLLAASTNRDPKEVQESEVDQLYEESIKKRLNLEKELKAFDQRQREKLDQINEKSDEENHHDPSRKPWWKLGL